MCSHLNRMKTLQCPPHRAVVRAGDRCCQALGCAALPPSPPTGRRAAEGLGGRPRGEEALSEHSGHEGGDQRAVRRCAHQDVRACG